MGDLVRKRCREPVGHGHGVGESGGPGTVVAGRRCLVGRLQQQTERGIAAARGQRDIRGRPQVRRGLASIGSPGGGGSVVPKRLDQEAPGIDEVAQAAGQAVTQAIRARTGGGAERSPQVVGHLVEAGPPLLVGLGAALEAGGGFRSPAQLAFPGRGLLAAGRQLLQRVGAHGLQHAPPAALPVRARQQALVGQPADQVGQGRGVAVGRDGAGRVQVEPADEHAQPAEHRPFVVVEHVMAPADDRPQRMVARVRTAAAGQQAQPVVQA